MKMKLLERKQEKHLVKVHNNGGYLWLKFNLVMKEEKSDT
jgi:hypothetical protein